MYLNLSYKKTVTAYSDSELFDYRAGFNQNNNDE